MHRRVLESWLHGVVPLRRRFGFTFQGAWVVEDADELIWILGYDGTDGFDMNAGDMALDRSWAGRSAARYGCSTG